MSDTKRTTGRSFEEKLRVFTQFTRYDLSARQNRPTNRTV